MTIPRNVAQTLFHGASPGRWSRRSASVTEASFSGGCFMTPDPMLASMYCADWRSRDDKLEFLQAVIDEIIQLGDADELLSNGFVEEDEEGDLKLLESASAAHVLQTWSPLEISHHLVRPSVRSLHHYPTGAVIFPLRLRTDRIQFLDCRGHHFDDLPGEIVNEEGRYFTTDGLVDFLRGKTDAIWFMSLTDPAHSTAGEPGDTVYVYDPRHLSFHLSGQKVGHSAE